MTIRIYPSRLPGEPLEIHEHGALTLHQWLSSNVDNYRSDIKHPIAVEVDGENIPATEWFDYVIAPSSEVRIYPIPYGLEAGTIAWIAVAISAASVAYALFFAPGAVDPGGYSSGTGNSLEVNPA